MLLTVRIVKAALDARAYLSGALIANTQVYVLDSSGSPAPIGVPGELFLAGVGLAIGYWNRPALTARTFPSESF